MKFPFVTEAATFLERPNRYRVVAQLQQGGTVIHAHCPNPGRLHELLVPGARVHVSAAAHRDRKTAYDLRFVEHPESGQLVSLDTRLPNQLFAEGLAAGYFEPFAAYNEWTAEVTLAASSPHVDTAAGGRPTVRSRIDFRLTAPSQPPCWVEVKSASLVIDGCARFPDAVTARGRRHVLALAAVAARGERAAIVFIIQRADAQRLRPQWTTDPDFGEALVAAAAAGVELYAHTCQLTVREARLDTAVPVSLVRG